MDSYKLLHNNVDPSLLAGYLGGDATPLCCLCKTKLSKTTGKKKSGLWFCAPCFKSATFCEGCNKPITGEPEIYKSKKYHPQCLSRESRKCTGCRKDIFGKTITRDVKLANSETQKTLYYHPKCWKCSFCETILDEHRSFIRNGKPACHNCKSSTETTNKKVIKRVVVKTFTILDPNWQGEDGKEECGKCGTVIQPTDIAIDLGSNTYHLKCLSCKKCGTKNLDGKVQKTKDNQIMCSKCAKTGVKRQCARCLKPIQSSALTVEKDYYHPDCFVCWSCDRDLKGGYAMIGVHPYCGNCAAKKQLKLQSGAARRLRSKR